MIVSSGDVRSVDVVVTMIGSSTERFFRKLLLFLHKTTLRYCVRLGHFELLFLLGVVEGDFKLTLELMNLLVCCSVDCYVWCRQPEFCGTELLRSDVAPPLASALSRLLNPL